MLDAVPLLRAVNLHKTYRKDAEISERKAKIQKAAEVTHRQIAVIDQKLGALQEMKQHLEAKQGQYHGWLTHLDEQAATQPS